MIKLYKGDCLDVMPTLSEKSVDMILCDLPYGTTQCKWDIIIPFELLWEQYNRLITDNGVIVLFGSEPFSSILRTSNLPMYRYDWIWEKTQATGFLNAKRRPLVSHETISVFYRNQCLYMPQKTTGHKPINSYTKRAYIQNKTEVYGKVTKDISGGGETDRFPRSVIKFSSDKQKTKLDGTIHPTQKPVLLGEYLINTYTNKNNTVLDNTMGSGTFGVSAVNTNRNFIGIEKDCPTNADKYFQIAIRRITEAGGRGIEVYE